MRDGDPALFVTTYNDTVVTDAKVGDEVVVDRPSSKEVFPEKIRGEHDVCGNHGCGAVWFSESDVEEIYKY